MKPEWSSPGLMLQVGGMLEERRPLVSSRTEFPTLQPPQRPGPLVREPGLYLRAQARAPLSEPEELVDKSVT